MRSPNTRLPRRLLAELAAAESRRESIYRAQLAVTHNNLALLLAARGDVERCPAAIHGRRSPFKQRLAEQHRRRIRRLPANWPKARPISACCWIKSAMRQAPSDRCGARSTVLRPLAESQSRKRQVRPQSGDRLQQSQLCAAQARCRGRRELQRGEAIAILERLADEHPGEIQYQDDLALCYNNLAALESHQGGWSEAIDWHRGQSRCRSSWSAKAPAVVRHRSDLAISLNNLGVAYCRADRGEEADAAFARRSELLATLADDYPDELAYRSSLAALLNNQALALAGAGRHDQALAIYPAAIESQRMSYECHHAR